MACSTDSKKEIEMNLRASLAKTNPELTKEQVKIVIAEAIKRASTEGSSDLDKALAYKLYPGQKPPYLFPMNGLFSNVNKLAMYAIDLGIIKPIKATVTNKKVQDAAKGVVGLVTKPATAIVNSNWVQEFHKGGMSNAEGIYHRTFNVLKDRDTPSDFLNKNLVDMKVMGGVDYDRINTFLSKEQDASQKRNTTVTTILTDVLSKYRKVTSNYSPKAIKELESLFNISHIHIIDEADKDKIFNSKNSMEELDNQITILEKELLKGGIYEIGHTKMVENGINQTAIDLASMYHTRNFGNISDTGLSEREIYSSLGGTYLEKFIRLVALNQLKLGGNSQIATLAKFKKDATESGIYNDFLITSRGASDVSNTIDVDLQGNTMFKADNKTGRSLHFKKNYEFKTIVSKSALVKLKDSDKWVALRPYSKGTVGVYARERTDFGQASGIVSNTTIADDHAHIKHDDMLRYKFDLKSNNIEKRMYDRVPRYVLKLTQEMLDNPFIEMDNEIPSVLYRSYAHNIEISETIGTFRHILANQVTHAELPSQLAKIEAGLAKGIKPMFLRFDFSKGSLVNFDDYPLIKAKYVTTKGASSVLEFPKYANLVHKDVKHQMIGFSKKPIMQNNNKYVHKLEQILRDVVNMYAVRVAILNPSKVAIDAISNASILAINGVPIVSAYKYGKESVKYSSEMSNLRNDRVLLEMEARGTRKGTREHTLAKRKLDAITLKIDNHPYKVAISHGFVQSLSTQLLVGESEANEGLQNRIDELFAKVDNYPKVKSLLASMSKFGPSTAEILEYAYSKTTDGSTLDRELGRMSKKFRSIEDKGEQLKLISEFIGSPGQSELVRYMGGIVTKIDETGKYTLYRHMMDWLSENRSDLSLGEMDKISAKHARRSFPDYRANLSEGVTQAKDLGLFMFPHFILRTQATLYTMFHRRALSTGAVYLTMNQTPYGDDNIVNSLYPFKSTAEIGWNENLAYPAEFYKFLGL